MNRENRGIRPSIILLVLVFLTIMVITELNSRYNRELEMISTNVVEMSSEELNSLEGEYKFKYNFKEDSLEIIDAELGVSRFTDDIYTKYKNNEIENRQIKAAILSGIRTNNQTPIILMWVLLLILLLGVIFSVSHARSKGVTGVKESKNDVEVVDSEKLKVGIDDVKGHNEIIEDIRSVVDFIKNPHRYSCMGARLPKGVLLFGPPGTGKTMIAKAVAKESGVAFMQSSGSDFVEKYVGVGAKRVRELFKEARKNAPCIVFIDEIDAIGRQRGRDDNSERDNTLNALLTEMDGFTSGERIFVLASTNRIDILDDALTRAGRFDKHIAVQLPDVNGRQDILEIYAKNKPLCKDVDLSSIAKMTTSFSGADLENLMNEASIQAVKNKRKEITNQDIETAMYSIQVKGRQKTKYTRSELEGKLIAYHEAGHTLASMIMSKDSVTKVTIIPSTSGAGGITFTSPKDTTLMSKSDLENQLRMLYAGRAAEYILTGNEDLVTTGASNDIERATVIMKKMVSEFGMYKEFGVVNTNMLSGGDSKIEEKVKELSIRYYAEAIDFLNKHRDRLDYLSKQLLKYETLYEEQLIEIVGDVEIC